MVAFVACGQCILVPEGAQHGQRDREDEMARAGFQAIDFLSSPHQYQRKTLYDGHI
jgi:hypothetical protein